MAKYAYQETINLYHHEVPAKINKHTGEVKEISKKNISSNIPVGSSKVDFDEFVIVNQKLFTAIKLLGLSDKEIRVLNHMIGMSKFNSNSLDPLHDDLSVRVKASYLDLNKDEVNKIANRLFELGVYSKVAIYKNSVVNYWILNPYISWKGRLCDKAIKLQFEDCAITKLLK